MARLGRNDRVLLMCTALVAGMVGLAYASVPLYRIFCEVTGFAGTPRIAAEASRQVGERTIEVRFDANVSPDLAWEFKPEQVSMTVKVGENRLAFYRARNLAGAPVAGTATFNVTPAKAGQYFNKLQCFCFTRQELKARQSAEMGVSFFVDPAIAADPETRDVTAITLSYTFFPAKPEPDTLAAAAPGQARESN